MLLVVARGRRIRVAFFWWLFLWWLFLFFEKNVCRVYFGHSAKSLPSARQKTLGKVYLTIKIHRVSFAECDTRQTLCRVFFRLCRVLVALGKCPDSHSAGSKARRPASLPFPAGAHTPKRSRPAPIFPSLLPRLGLERHRPSSVARAAPLSSLLYLSIESVSRLESLTGGSRLSASSPSSFSRGRAGLFPGWCPPLRRVPPSFGMTGTPSPP